MRKILGIGNYGADEPIEKYLPKKERKWFRDQIQLGYKVPFPGFLYEIKVTRNYQHGTDIGISLTMKPQEIIDLLYQYIHSDKYGGYDEISSSKFKEAIKNKPYEFSLLAKKIISLNLEYCYQYISALDEAVSAKKSISWDKVLTLCSFLFKQSTPFYKFSFQVGNAIASLLINGIVSAEGTPFRLRKKIWSIIKLLTNIALKQDDEFSYLKDDKEIREEYSYLVYNSNIGLTLELVLKYVIWCYDNLNKKSGLVEEAKKLLEEILATSKNLGTLGPICFYLNTLIIIDKNWTRQNIEKILISKSYNKVLYYALWECYFVRNRCTPQIYDSLFPLIKNRIEDLKNDPKSLHKSTATGNLIVYVAQAYLFGFKESDLLLNTFLRKAPRYLKSLFLSEIGDLLRIRKEGKQYNFNIEKIRKIWGVGELQDYPELLTWFVNSPFDKRFSISKLFQFLEKNRYNYGIFPSDIFLFTNLAEELRNYITEETVTTLKCIRILSNVANKKGLLLNIKDIVFQTIGMVRKKNANVTNEINDIRDFYGRCGFTDFRN